MIVYELKLSVPNIKRILNMGKNSSSLNQWRNIQILNAYFMLMSKCVYIKYN